MKLRGPKHISYQKNFVFNVIFKITQYCVRIAVWFCLNWFFTLNLFVSKMEYDFYNSKTHQQSITNTTDLINPTPLYMDYIQQSSEWLRYFHTTHIRPQRPKVNGGDTRVHRQKHTNVDRQTNTILKKTDNSNKSKSNYLDSTWRFLHAIGEGPRLPQTAHWPIGERKPDTVWNYLCCALKLYYFVVIFWVCDMFVGVGMVFRWFFLGGFCAFVVRLGGNWLDVVVQNFVCMVFFLVVECIFMLVMKY